MRYPGKSYGEYLKSEEWRKWRELYFSVHPKMCAVCYNSTGVQLHHRQYDNVRSKRFKDYAPLCKDHHDKLTQMWRTTKNSLGMNLDQFTTWFIQNERRRSGRNRQGGTPKGYRRPNR